MRANNRKLICVAAALIIFFSGSAFGQSLVGRNSNVVGPTPDGNYRGIPHYQDNEPHCDRNPLLPGNIICMGNGYAGADDLIGDAWPRIYETQDNARTWVSRFATGSAADSTTSLGLGFGADPIMVCWPGACGGFLIASDRAAGGGSGGGVYMQLLPEINIETGFRHLSESGLRTVQLTTGNTFLDKIDAIYLVDTRNPGTVDIEVTVNRGNGITEVVERQWPKGRLIVVYAAINASQQNIRIYSTFSDDYGTSWSSPKQVANTTGVDTGVAVAAIDDTILYAYRQFSDDSGDQVDAVFAAVSTTRGRTIRKPFVVVDDLCAFDQPTLPNSDDPCVVASRTNNFVDVSADGGNFVMVLAERRRDPSGGCLTQPFDYPAGSRVLLTTAGSNGKGWKTPVEIAPLAAGEHSFQFMPAVDCTLGVCQSIWYDSINDSRRNINFLNASGRGDVVDAFKSLPLFADFIYPRTLSGGGTEFLQFRRTVDVNTRQFEIANGNIVFRDEAPVRVSRFQLALIGNEVLEVEQISFNLKQYKSNSVSFMGDYIGLASVKVRGHPDPTDPTGPPIYEPNNGADPLNPLLKPSWFAFWTDTRNARGQLYTQNIGDALPFEKTDTGGLMSHEGHVPDETGEALLPVERKLSAEGVEDSSPGDPVVGFCARPTDPPTAAGDILLASENLNRVKDADIYGALIEVPATAWVLNASKGLGEIQRSYVIAARNEKSTGTSYRFRIMNQPVGSLTEARASWEQLPWQNFSAADTPLVEIDESVGPQSSVSVALFVISSVPVNPVTVNVYEVDASGNEALVETLTVNGALEAGDLLNADFELNVLETHNPVVFAPNTFDPDIFNPDVWNPDVWNPDVWNPDVWNPDVWNPDVWNPDVWNPDVWNPDVWNPDVWNPDVWNVSLTSADDLDNAEIPSPDVDGLARDEFDRLAKFDVQFNALNSGNTLTPYTADFAVSSPLVRQLLADGEVRTQIIVSQDARFDSYQACDPDVTGENRILAVVNDADFLNLKIPDIFNNRFGSVTYYSAPGDRVQITIRFVAATATIRSIAPELINNGVSYVVTSQVANTGDSTLSVGQEQVIGDFTPPTLSVDPDETVLVRATTPLGAILPDDLVTATKGEFENPAVSCAPIDLGEQAPLGPTDLTCSATSENAVTASVDITADVVDLDPPVLDTATMPADITLQREIANAAVVNYSLPTVSDLIDVNVAAICTPLAPGDAAPFSAPGPTTTEVSCKAVDAAGEGDSSSFFVTVEDTVPPVLVVPTSASVEASSAAGASVTFVPLPSATDVGTVGVSCTRGDPAVGVASGDLFPIGTTPVTCIATDDANLSTSDGFVISVADTVAPIITTVDDISAEANTNAGTIVNFMPPTATDFGNPIAVNCDANSGDTFPLGSTVVACTTVPDAGNLTAMSSFSITVVDTTAPILTVPADIAALLGASVTFNATATDVADANPIVTCTPGSGSSFPLGTTIVNCTATDASGNSDSASFSVAISLGAGSGLSSNKRSVKSGSVAGFNWVWEDALGNAIDVGEGNQDIEARLGTCSNPEGDDILDEDPGSSDIRRSGDGWQFNWQTVDENGDGLAAGTYCVSVKLLTTNPVQSQSTEIRVRK